MAYRRQRGLGLNLSVGSETFPRGKKELFFINIAEQLYIVLVC